MSNVIATIRQRVGRRVWISEAGLGSATGRPIAARPRINLSKETVVRGNEVQHVILPSWDDARVIRIIII